MSPSWRALPMMVVVPTRVRHMGQCSSQALAPWVAAWAMSALVVTACFQTDEPRSVLVSAAISLTEPMQTIASRFEARTGVNVRLNLAGSNTLATQALNGAPVDVFISADDAQMDRLASANLLDERTRVVLLSNRLVVIVPLSSTLKVTVPADLAGPSVKRVAIGDPAAVPVGRYAAAYLRARGVWPRVEPRLVFFPHVRAVTTAVEQGAADEGIVYRTDARVAKGVRIALEIDEEPRWVIAYPMAVLRRAPHADDARAFATFLREPDTLQVFVDAGFALPVRKS